MNGIEVGGYSKFKDQSISAVLKECEEDFL
jgi:hypothetical protein